MTNHALTGIALAAACLAAGFVAGRATADTKSPDDLAATSGSAAAHHDPAAMQSRIADLERERDELRQRLDELARVERVPMSGPTQTNGDANYSAAASTPASDAEADAGKVLDAASTLQAIKAAIAEGDADAFAKLQDPAVANKDALAPDLVAMLDSADSLFAKEQLADLLGQLGDPRALPALHNLLENESDDAVRTSVVRALGLIPDESSVGLLTAEFGRESSSPMPPSLAATSLGQIGSSTAIAALTREIEQGDNGMVRAFAMQALAERKDPRLVPFFFGQARRDGANDRSRKQAIEAIAATGARSAVPELETLAFSNAMSRGVQESAKRAINQILGETRYPVR